MRTTKKASEIQVGDLILFGSQQGRVVDVDQTPLTVELTYQPERERWVAPLRLIAVTLDHSEEVTDLFPTADESDHPWYN